MRGVTKKPSERGKMFGRSQEWHSQQDLISWFHSAHGVQVYLALQKKINSGSKTYFLGKIDKTFRNALIHFFFIIEIKPSEPSNQLKSVVVTD